MTGKLCSWYWRFLRCSNPLALLLPKQDGGWQALRRARGVDSAPPAALIPFARLHWQLFTLIGLSAMVSYAQGAWTAEYVVRRFGWPEAQIGVALGLIDMLLPLPTHLVMGFVVDRLARRGRMDAPLRVALVMRLIALPFALGKYLAPSPALFLFCYGVCSLLLAPTVLLGALVLQQFAPSALRGRVAAAFVAFENISGMTLGPSITGAGTEFAFEGSAGLGHALTLVTVVGLTGETLLLWIALKRAARGCKAGKGGARQRRKG